MKKGIFLLLLLCSHGVLGAGYNGLKMQTRTVYPEEIHSIQHAMVYLLEPTGYQLVIYPETATAPRESGLIIKQALSPVARTNDVMTIESALLQVIGDDNALIVDHEHQLISVEPFDQ